MQLRFTALVISLLCLLFGHAGELAAQVVPTDTVGLGDEDPKPLLVAEEFERVVMPDSLPDPRKAAFLSAILPGMGQVYNNGLWKVPLVYAGGAAFIYGVNFYNQRYSESLKTLRQIRWEPEFVPPANRTEATYQRAVNFYRRQRDYLIILSVAYYGIQIVEAYVDAHLQSFDTDDELSFKAHPTIIPNFAGGYAPGIRITYTFP